MSRWHVCRVNFARKIYFFSSHEFSYEKCSEIFPEIFEPMFCGSEKIPGKFPPNFPLNFPNFPTKNQKKFTDELLQERRENDVRFFPCDTGNIGRFEERGPALGPQGMNHWPGAFGRGLSLNWWDFPERKRKDMWVPRNPMQDNAMTVLHRCLCIFVHHHVGISGATMFKGSTIRLSVPVRGSWLLLQRAVQQIRGGPGESAPLTRPSVNCWIVGRGPGAFNCQGSGASLRT